MVGESDHHRRNSLLWGDDRSGVELTVELTALG